MLHNLHKSVYLQGLYEHRRLFKLSSSMWMSSSRLSQHKSSQDIAKISSESLISECVYANQHSHHTPQKHLHKNSGLL